MDPANFIWWMLFAELIGCVAGMLLMWIFCGCPRSAFLPPRRDHPARDPLAAAMLAESRERMHAATATTDAIIRELEKALDEWEPGDSTEPDGPDGLRQIQLKED